MQHGIEVSYPGGVPCHLSLAGQHSRYNLRMPSRPRTAPRQLELPGVTERSSRPAVTAARLPTNTTASHHAVHRWFNFIAGYSPEFVEQQCRGHRSLRVLDPFAGCGTSLVVAQDLGHTGVGYEAHPFFARIARAKVEQVIDGARLAAIDTALRDGLESHVCPETLPSAAKTFLLKLFDRDALAALLGARDCLKARGLAADDLAFLMLSRILDLCSHAKTDGIYKAPTSKKRAAAPSEAVHIVVATVRKDVADGSHLPVLPAEVHERSSECMAEVPTASVDIAVTSPPYLNNFDYAEMTRMYLYFWGMCSSWREITDSVRAKLVVNTTTALAGHRDRQDEYRDRITPPVQLALDTVVTRLREQRRSRAGKKEYDLLVYPYFAQMTNVLSELQRCLSRDSHAHIVVADAAFYGVHIATQRYLSEIMSSLGFSAVRCTRLRTRGHRWTLAKREGSVEGLGEYHIAAIRG